jgi:hypothetical protein
MNSNLPTSRKYPSEKEISKKFGLVIDNSGRAYFFFYYEDEQLVLEKNQGHFW